MKLVIVESPSKAKTIEKYLSDSGDIHVRASVGHVRDLPKSNKKAIDIPAGFVPHYEISKGKEKVVDELRAIAHKASEIILATDPDREGEAISWHLAELLREDKKVKAPIKRVTFNEITKEVVSEALKHPRDIDSDLVKAQEARRVLDRLVGYDLSGLIWKKVRYGLSAGRVQSPALRILVEREREIRAFIPETYWVLSGIFKTPKKDTITLTCTEEPRDKKEVDRILTAGNNSKWIVKDIKESEQKRSPRAPFTTSTLQQTASSRLGFSPSRTMQVAQKLYEAGHITYMRTDSTTLGGQAVAQIATLIEKKFGKEYVEVRTYKTKSKNAQEAHEAIRPTHFDKTDKGVTDEQKRLYRLIWERAVSSQMADAKLSKTRIVGNVQEDSIPDFTTTGSRVLFPGWLAVDTDARGEDIELPKLIIGDPLDLQDLTSLEKQTEPPHRYSEAGLVKELEARGIGRPSTYASIISTLENREYVEKINKALKPTDTGEVVSTFLEANFMEYISDTFTAEMEDKLDDIANGDREYVKTLTDFYGPFTKHIKEKESVDKLTTLEVADAKYKCPKCGSGMVVKLGRGGKFLSCDLYPECDGALTIDGVEIKKDEPIGIDPETGLPVFLLIGRFGPYVQLGELPPKKAKKKSVKKVSKKKTKTEEENPVELQSETVEEKEVIVHPSQGKRASVPKTVDPGTVTLEMALKYLSLPRVLGAHPETGTDVSASAGRFGPYVVHDGNFRSIKPPLDVYTITLAQALELLAQEKKPRGFARKTTTTKKK